MQAYFPPKGLIVELPSLDKQLFLKHLNLLKKEADAVMLLSPEIGKGLDIPMDKKIEIIKLSTEVINGQIPIFVFVTSYSEDKTRENILEFERLLSSYNGPVFWVDAPLYYHSNRGLPEMYQRFFSITNYPFILYNNPEFVKKVKGPFNRKNIRTSVLKELVFLEEIKGLIYIGKLKRALNYQKAVRERPSFLIYDGDEILFLNFPNKNGLVSASANLIPKVWRKILNNEIKEERELLYMLFDFLSIIKKRGKELIESLLKGTDSDSMYFNQAKKLLEKLRQER